MATGNRLGAAYVEVEGDVVSFVRKLKQELIQAANALKPYARFMGEMIGHEMEQGVKGTGRAMARRIQAELNASRITAKVDLSLDRDTVAKMAKSAASGAASGGAEAGSQVSRLLGNLGGNLSGLASSPQGLIILAALILTLAGAVTALGVQLGLLLNFALLLPGAFAALIAVIAPLTVALNGMGEIFSSILSGDGEALTEALRGMPPAVQAIAKEFMALAPLLKGIEYWTQQAFWQPLLGTLTSIGKTLLPTIGEGFTIVAGAAGRLVAAIGKILSSPEAVAGIKNVFVTMGLIIDNLIGPLGTLFRGLGALVSASMPALLTISMHVGALLEELGQWFTEIAADGSFQEFINEAMEAMGRFWDIGVALWNLLATLIDQAKVEAGYFLDALVAVIDAFTIFFESEIGKLALQGIIDLAIGVVLALAAIGIAVGIVVGAITGLIRLVVFLIDKIVEAINAMRQLAGMGPIIPSGNDDGPELGGGGPGSGIGKSLLGKEEVARKRNNAPSWQSGGFNVPVQSKVGADDTPVVNVYIGEEKIDAKAVKASHALLERQGRELSYGPRVTA